VLSQLQPHDCSWLFSTRAVSTPTLSSRQQSPRTDTHPILIFSTSGIYTYMIYIYTIYIYIYIYSPLYPPTLCDVVERARSFSSEETTSLDVFDMYNFHI
jgi:hypothetical protein